MRFYTGQSFVGSVAGVRHMFTTVEQYAGGPVEVRADDGARFSTAILSRMLDGGSAMASHSCVADGLADHTPAYLRAERCARCQQLAGHDGPGELASMVAGR